MIPRELVTGDSLALYGDGAPITLTPPGKSPVVVHGEVISVGVHADLNGIAALGDHKGVTFASLELAGLGYPNPSVIKAGGWLISATDADGLPISGKPSVILIDATLGRVTISISEDDA